MKIHTHVAGALLFAAAGCGGGAEDPPRDLMEAGWSVRLDDPDRSPVALRFVRRGDGNGVEVRQGPNACLWPPDLRAAGEYRVSVDVTHLDSGEHPHGAGLTLGGVDVLGAGQRYTYFLVRGDGCFLIKSRGGDATDDVVSWTRHDAVAPEDDDGVTRNRLAVEVRGEEVRFLVNGTEVHRGRREDLATDGRVGLRLVHDLHVKFGEPVVEML